MNEESNVYRELQRHLDESPAGFAATESGADIRLLQHLLTPQEAAIAKELSNIKPETVRQIHKRLVKKGMHLSGEELQETLEGMVRKGTILVFTGKRQARLYKNVGVSAGGMIDFQVNRLTRDLVDDLDKYHEESFIRERKRPTTPQLRTVPVEKSNLLGERQPVAAYDDIRHLVEQSPGPFSVANCICRQMKDLRGQGCGYSDIRETCLQIGPDHARQYVEMGVGRFIDRDEVFAILDRAQEAGFILQPENSKLPQNVCCCCGDCCGPLTAAKRLPRPADIFASNYRAVVDTELCQSCEVCISRCQMDAVTMKDGVAWVDIGRCIGCGNCIATCEHGAMGLVRKEHPLVPPRNKDATFMKILSQKMDRKDLWLLRVKKLLGMSV
jgi:electron transport complex protein RnfB